MVYFNFGGGLLVLPEFLTVIIGKRQANTLYDTRFQIALKSISGAKWKPKQPYFNCNISMQFVYGEARNLFLFLAK